MVEPDGAGNEDASRCAIDGDGSVSEVEVGSVGGCDVKDRSDAGEMMRNDSVVGMLRWRNEKNFAGVWWVKDGDIGVRGDWKCKRDKVKTGNVIHGVLFWVVAALL